MSASQVPWAYRLFFLYVEPISALLGAFKAFFEPDDYLRLTHAASAPSAEAPLAVKIVLYQLSNLYLLFAMNEALLLRVTQDMRVWKIFLANLLLADIGHLYSVRGLGPDVYLSPCTWTMMDWGNVAFVYLGATMRIMFLLSTTVPVSDSLAPRVGTSY